jgi:hypothetical protein
MKGIHLFKAINSDKLEKLISVFTQKEIAGMFNCTESTVSQYLTDTLTINNVETNKSIYDTVPIYRTKGSWMNSAERNSFIEMKKSIEYN